MIHTGRSALPLLIEDTSQVGHARREASRLASSIGFDEGAAGKVALVATELASNLLKHATRGTMYLSLVPGRSCQGIELVTVDQGPGFALHQCLADGYSTRGTQGIGLGGISRQSQVLDAWSDAQGSVVVARLYPNAQKSEDLRIGACQLSLPSEPVSGDGWAMGLGADDLAVMMVDGLGHGVLAHEAAQAACSAFVQAPFDGQLAQIDRLHKAMAGGRGGAVALARVQLKSHAMSYLGIGNIAGSVASDEGSRGMASMPGIVGGAFRKPQVFQSVVSGGILILHSDGLSTRWNLRDFPGLLRRHPAVLAWALHRHASRGRDDATVVAFDLGALA